MFFKRVRPINSLKKFEAAVRKRGMPRSSFLGIERGQEKGLTGASLAEVSVFFGVLFCFADKEPIRG
jgi:hypothetical protein